MYVRTGEILAAHGYRRYEISNYALPGRECRHNTGYWTHVPYLGFGAAAASFVPSEDGKHTWEVDVFEGENEGLIMAEIELESEDDVIEKPAFIGKEVTGDRRFYNKHMLRYPFSLWRETLPEEYR